MSQMAEKRSVSSSQTDHTHQSAPVWANVLSDLQRYQNYLLKIVVLLGKNDYINDRRNS